MQQAFGTVPGTHRIPTEQFGVNPIVRVAAIGDFHIRTHVEPALVLALEGLPDQADVLVIPGDITDNGRLQEFQIAADVLAEIDMPIIAVLGNHDRRCLRRAALRRILESAGVCLLDGDATMVSIPARSNGQEPSLIRIGFAGVGGYGGGFWPEEPVSVPPLHRATQALAVRARREASRLEAALLAIDPMVDLRIVLLHYSPTISTLGREPIVKHWMLGNSQLGHVIDRFPVDLVVHGHAHLGNVAGQTTGGTPVRNVAIPVIGAPAIYALPIKNGTGTEHQDPSQSQFATVGSHAGFQSAVERST